MSQAPDPSELERLIAVCLELHERKGPQAVEAVLSDHPESSRLVRERLDRLGRLGLVGEAPRDSMPERIGDYEVIGVLGRGGMSVVYEVQQRTPRRRVALKVLRSMPGDWARGRLQHEAELLARLQHPGIAHVYEVGTANLGGLTVPFFAMELVRGKPLDQYANEAGLGVRERLELLVKVCERHGCALALDSLVRVTTGSARLRIYSISLNRVERSSFDLCVFARSRMCCGVFRQWFRSLSNSESLRKEPAAIACPGGKQG